MVRPIDLQDNLAKTTIVEKVAQAEKAQPESAQKQFAATNAEKNAEHQRKTVQPQRSDEAILRRERGKDGQTKQDDDGDQRQESNEHRDHDAERSSPEADAEASDRDDHPHLDVQA